MVYFLLAVSALLFALGIRFLGLVARSRQVVDAVRGALAVIRAEDLDDHEKEIRIQKAATRMLLLFGSLLWRTVVLLAIPLLFLALWIALGTISVSETVRIAGSWPFILVASVLTLLALAGQR